MVLIITILICTKSPSSSTSLQPARPLDLFWLAPRRNKGWLHCHDYDDYFTWEGDCEDNGHDDNDDDNGREYDDDNYDDIDDDDNDEDDDGKDYKPALGRLPLLAFGP